MNDSDFKDLTDSIKEAGRMRRQKVLYRYADPMIVGHGCELDLLTYAVAKETPCGYWLFLTWDIPGVVSDTYKVPDKRHWQWRSKTGHFAFENKDDALASYIVRKQRHLEYLKRTVARAEEGLAEAYRMTSGIPKKPQPVLPAARSLAALLKAFGG